MTPSREEALFALALEKLAEKRPAFLDAVCEGDTALRARLEALLAAHEPQPRLVDERGGLERVAGGFVRHLMPGEPAQLVIDQREQLGRGLGIALLDGVQQPGDVAHGPCVAASGRCVNGRRKVRHLPNCSVSRDDIRRQLLFQRRLTSSLSQRGPG